MKNEPTTMTLADLIQFHRNGRKYADLAKACGMSTTNLHWLASKPIVDFPSTAKLRGLSQGLNVSEGAILEAVAHSVGLNPSLIQSNDLVVRDGKLLPRDSQEVVLSVADAMLQFSQTRKFDSLRLEQKTEEYEKLEKEVDETTQKLHLVEQENQRMRDRLQALGVDPSANEENVLQLHGDQEPDWEEMAADRGASYDKNVPATKLMTDDDE